ncbi:MAG: glycosyltransferase [Rhodanobacteraceae bacterium]
MPDSKPTHGNTSNHPILVLGMHRSGTSAVTGVLELMGAWVGDEDNVLPAHPADNPTGYRERVDVLIQHDRMLEELGFAWDRLAGFDPMSIDQGTRRKFAAALSRIVGTIDSGGRPWALKDPRLCVLLPLWRELLEKPAFVVVVRDPSEIAASMHRSHRGGYPTPYLYALWEKYMRTLLDSLDGERALFVSYSTLLSEPQTQCRRLLEGLADLGLGGLHVPTPDDLGAFLDPSLRRNLDGSTLDPSAEQQALYDWLQARTLEPGPALVSGFPRAPEPDAVLRDYERARSHQDECIREQSLGGLADRLAKIESSLAQEHQRLVNELAEQRRIAETAHAHIRNIELHNKQLSHDLTQRTDTLERAQREFDRLQKDLADVSTHATERERAVFALKRSFSWRLTAPLRWLLDLLALRLPHALEQGAYKLYYAIPGLTDERKRAAIVWCHEHASWLTRNTDSYRLYKLDQAVSGMRDMPRRMDAERARKFVETLTDPPLISIVMPVYNVKRRWLLAAVDSVRNQYYPHWELCMVDDASTNAETREVLDELGKDTDKRIRIRRLSENRGIAGASNAALEMAEGDYVGFLDHDDELTRDALTETASRILSDNPDLVYSDEDKLHESGGHFEPHFKPDFSPDFFLSNNYLCHFTVIRRALLDRVGGFRVGFDGAQDFDLFLRVSEQTQNIAHVPLVLYHWRVIAGSTAGGSEAKPQAADAGLRAIKESLARRAIEAKVTHGPLPATYCVRRKILRKPLVSILIPFRDNAGLLQTCVTSILEKSTYANYEILGIDNGSVKAETHELMRGLVARDSRVRFVRHDIPFNYSSIMNFAVGQAKGEHLLLLNDDTEVISIDWIEAMLEHSLRPEVGVVGAKLLYPDKTIQHGGVIIGLGGVAGHAHLQLPADHPGYFLRPQLIQNVSAVTFACAMIKRSIFEKVGGLNERDLTIAYNDIDFCLRVREAGYLIVYAPHAVLFHHESKSRGQDDTPEKQARYANEIRYMQSRYATLLAHGDPYYNVNLSLTCGYEPIMSYVDALPR